MKVVKSFCREDDRMRRDKMVEEQVRYYSGCRRLFRVVCTLRSLYWKRIIYVFKVLTRVHRPECSLLRQVLSLLCTQTLARPCGHR